MVKTIYQTKRIIKLIIGFTVLGACLAMTVLPGPAIVVIPAGLGILATELPWAKKLLQNIKRTLPKRYK